MSVALAKQISSGSGSVTIVTDTLAGADWNASGTQYYGDVDTSSIGNRNIVVNCYNTTNRKRERPANVDLSVDVNTVRIWMPTNTVSLDIVVVGT